MSTNLADVVVHIDESLPMEQLNTLENHIHKINGVVCACNRDEKPHLLTVVYNPNNTKAYDILASIKKEGLHAELVGL